MMPHSFNHITPNIWMMRGRTSIANTNRSNDWRNM